MSRTQHSFRTSQFDAYFSRCGSIVRGTLKRDSAQILHFIVEGDVGGQGIRLWDNNGDNTQSVHHIWILNNIISGYGQSGVQINDGEFFYVIHNKIFDNSNVTCDAQGSGVSMGFLKAFNSYTPVADDSNNSVVDNIGTAFTTPSHGTSSTTTL